MFARLICLIGLYMLLSGCSLLTSTTIPMQKPARIGLQLTPASLGETMSVQQHLTVERAGHTNELDTALEIDSHHLELVGLALGQRVMTLSYDGKNLAIWRHPMMPKQLRGEDILEDLQLTLWPAQVIRQALPMGWQLETNNQCRTLFLNNVPVIMITYSNKQPWNGTIVLTNLRYHYRLTIQSLITP